MKFLIALTLFAVTLLVSVHAQADSVKIDSLKHLQELRTENAKRLKDIDDTLRKRVEEGDADLATEVTDLRAKRQEHQLRQDFLDRLVAQIDSHFSGGDLRAFLEGALTEMAKVDAVAANGGLCVFMRYAAEAVKRLPEQKENILAFLEGYMNRSISKPIPPKEFLASRNYTNGAESESGAPLSREVVGAIADRRLQEMAHETPAEPSVQQAPAVEQNLKQ